MGYLPNRKVPAIIQIRDVLECAVGLAKATGMVTFDDTVTDGEELVVNDGVTERTYTFQDLLDDTVDEVQIATIGTITGTLVPDITEVDFVMLPSYANGKPAWYSATAGYYIYWNGVNKWIIWVDLGDVPKAGAGGDIFWSRTNADPEGAYAASTEASGAATFGLDPDYEATRDNLLAVMNDGDDPDAVTDPRRGVWGTAALSDTDPAITLINTVAGVLGNVSITTDADFTVTGMSGGSDGSSLVPSA